MKKMQSVYSKDNINLNSLMDYVFQKLSSAEEDAMEHFLDENEEYSDTVNGILNYCLKENIKTKEALEKNLLDNKTAFFKKFPKIDPKNLKTPKKIINENKPNKNKFVWLLLLLLIAFGVTFTLLKSPFSKIESKNKKVENIETLESDKGMQNNTTSNINKEKNDLKKEDDDSLQDVKLTPSSNKDRNSQKENPKKNKKAPQANLSPQNFKSIGKEIESQHPLIAQANETWSKEFEVLGNPPLDNAINQLAKGDSTAYARYCVGLYELTKEKPDLEKSIQLLTAIPQYEFPDATWYLFRAYLLSGDIDKAKLTFKKMKSNAEYYNEIFLKKLSPSVVDFLN